MSFTTGQTTKHISRYALSLITILTLILITCSSDDKPSSPNTPEPPDVTTATVSSITETTASSGGTVTADGGAVVSARGICWSTSSSPDTADEKQISGSGTGAFTAELAGLTAGTPYYVRAFAINTAGVGYGNEQSFTTSGGATTGTVTDIDGNVYPTVRIGTQWWMAENLRVTRYSNGDSIPRVTDNGVWAGLYSGAYCEFANDPANIAGYGLLYNWYAAVDSRDIAPIGWHTPTDAEWKTLEIYLGMNADWADSLNWRGVNEGGKLKEADTLHWSWPNVGGTNESGFTARGSSFRGYDGDFDSYLKGSGYFWSASQFPSYDTASAYGRHVAVYSTQINRGGHVKQDGFSIRCVKD